MSTDFTNRLEADIQSGLKALSEEAQQHRLNLSRDVIHKMAARCRDLSVDILAIKASERNPVPKIIELMADEIIRVADGNLAVTSYQLNSKARQPIEIYVGTHWVTGSPQLSIDLVRLACEQAKVPKEFRDSPTFIERLKQTVALRLSGERPVTASGHTALINLHNGTLTIDSEGKTVLREHRREDYLSYCLGYSYAPEADCPKFKAYLAQVLPDGDTQRTLAQYLAYCFTQGKNPEKMLVLLGTGSNGKSVLLGVVEALVGAENVSNVSLSDLTNDDEKRSLIDGKLLNISFESGRDLDTAVLKTLVSQEPITVRRLYIGTSVSRQYAKLITSYNELPRAEHSHGFFRRIIIVPFKVTIGESEQDPDLVNKLRQELPGILNWVLQAMPQFLSSSSIQISEECHHELNRYRASSDSVQMFLSMNVKADPNSSTKGSDLFDAYKNFCQEWGCYQLGKQKFFQRLEALGHAPHKYNGVVFFNLKVWLNDDDEVPVF